MLRLLTTSRCVFEEPNKSLVNYAIQSGQGYKVDIVLSNTKETDKVIKLGLGLPVLIREDGAMSKDGENWFGAPKEKKRVKDDSEDVAGVQESPTSID